MDPELAPEHRPGPVCATSELHEQHRCRGPSPHAPPPPPLQAPLPPFPSLRTPRCPILPPPSGRRTTSRWSGGRQWVRSRGSSSVLRGRICTLGISRCSYTNERFSRMTPLWQPTMLREQLPCYNVG